MTENIQRPGNSESYGLSEDWSSVQKILEEIIPVYDKTNRYISLGSDLKIRKKGLELLRRAVGKPYFSTVDLGTGTGRLSQLFLERSRLEKAQAADGLVLMDPIRPMMAVAKSRVGTDGVLGVFEYAPFQGSSFDAAMAGFSLRDARVLTKALEEVHRILRQDGKFLIVDLTKPDSTFKRRLIAVYWRAIAPLIAFLSSGRLGLKFAALATTYSRLPKSRELISLAQSLGFSLFEDEYFMMGGAGILILSRQ